MDASDGTRYRTAAARADRNEQRGRDEPRRNFDDAHRRLPGLGVDRKLEIDLCKLDCRSSSQSLSRDAVPIQLEAEDRPARVQDDRPQDRGLADVDHVLRRRDRGDAIRLRAATGRLRIGETAIAGLRAVDGSAVAIEAGIAGRIGPGRPEVGVDDDDVAGATGEHERKQSGAHDLADIRHEPGI